MSRWHTWLESMGDVLLRTRVRADRFVAQGGVGGAARGVLGRGLASLSDLKDIRHFRRWLRTNQALLSISSVGVIVISAVLIGWQTLAATPGRAIRPVGQAWCFDLRTGKTFTESEAKAPPFATAAGAMEDGSPAGVRCEVYSCGSCGDRDQRFVGWLWKFTPAVKPRIQEIFDTHPQGYPDDDPYTQPSFWGDMDGLLIASESALDEWVPLTSDEGIRIQAQVMAKCAGSQLTKCLPE